MKEKYHVFGDFRENVEKLDDPELDVEVETLTEARKIVRKYIMNGMETICVEIVGRCVLFDMHNGKVTVDTIGDVVCKGHAIPRTEGEWAASAAQMEHMGWNK